MWLMSGSTCCSLHTCAQRLWGGVLRLLKGMWATASPPECGALAGRCWHVEQLHHLCSGLPGADQGGLVQLSPATASTRVLVQGEP